MTERKISGGDSGFREFLKGVKPLEQDKRPPWRDVPAPRARSAGGGATGPRAGAGAKPAAVHDGGGLQRAYLKRLRRGELRPERSIDLHGHRQRQAWRALQDFVDAAVTDDCRVVLVVHGRGLRSEFGEPVIKHLAREFRAAHPRVLAYCDAVPAHGGEGATYACLRRSKTPRR